MSLVEPWVLRPRRFLLATWDGLGSVIAELAWVSRLLQRGHHVTVLGPASVESSARAAGAAFVFDRVVRYGSSDRPPERVKDESGWAIQNILLGPAIAHANEVVEVARLVQADVVLADGMLYGAMIGAQASRLPSVALTHVPYGFTQPQRDAAADHPRLAILESRLGEINQARGQFALPPLASVFEQVDELDLNAVLSVRELDRVIKLPDNLRYIGPAIDNTPADTQIVPEGARTVLVSFSTGDQGQRDAVQGVLDALATSDFRVIVTAGKALNPNDFRIPGNATAHTYLPHSAILPRTDVVVTHAGHGTVMSALAYGVPMVCLPLGRDQPYNAARVAAVGAGLRLAPTARGSEIAEAVETVVTTPAFKQAATGLRQAIERTTAHGVDELERVGWAPI